MSDRFDSILVRGLDDTFEDDVTWEGLLERAMRTARSGMPDRDAERRVLAVVRGALRAGVAGALLADTSPEASSYVMTLLQAVAAHEALTL